MGWIPNQPALFQGNNNTLQNNAINNPYAQSGTGYQSNAYSNNFSNSSPNLQSLMGVLTQLVSLLSQQMQSGSQQPYGGSPGYSGNPGGMGGGSPIAPPTVMDGPPGFMGNGGTPTAPTLMDGPGSGLPTGGGSPYIMDGAPNQLQDGPPGFMGNGGTPTAPTLMDGPGSGLPTGGGSPYIMDGAPNQMQGTPIAPTPMDGPALGMGNGMVGSQVPVIMDGAWDRGQNTLELDPRETGVLSDRYNLGQATNVRVIDHDNNGLINKGDSISFDGEGGQTRPDGLPTLGGMIQVTDLDVQLLEGSETTLNLSPAEAAQIQQRFNLPDLNYRLVDVDKSGNLSAGDELLSLATNNVDAGKTVGESDVHVLNGNAKVFQPSAMQDLAIRDRFNLGPNDAYQLLDIGANGTISNGDELTLPDGSRATINKYDIAVIDNLLMSTEAGTVPLSAAQQQMLQQQMNLPANERFIVMDRDQNGQLTAGDELLNITPRGTGDNSQFFYDESVDPGSNIQFGSRIVTADAAAVANGSASAFPLNANQAQLIQNRFHAQDSNYAIHDLNGDNQISAGDQITISRPNFAPDGLPTPPAYTDRRELSQADAAILNGAPTLNLNANEMQTLINRSGYIQPNNVSSVQVYDIDNNGVVNPGDELNIYGNNSVSRYDQTNQPFLMSQEAITAGDVQALQGTLQQVTLTPQQEVNLNAPYGNTLQFVNDIDYSGGLSLGDELVAVNQTGEPMYVREVDDNTLRQANGLEPIYAFPMPIGLGMGGMPAASGPVGIAGGMNNASAMVAPQNNFSAVSAIPQNGMGMNNNAVYGAGASSPMPNNGNYAAQNNAYSSSQAPYSHVMSAGNPAQNNAPIVESMMMQNAMLAQGFLQPTMNDFAG